MQSATPPMVRPLARYSRFRAASAGSGSQPRSSRRCRAAPSRRRRAVDRGGVLHPLHEQRHEVEGGVVGVPARVQGFPVARPAMLEHGGQAGQGLAPDAAQAVPVADAGAAGIGGAEILEEGGGLLGNGSRQEVGAAAADQGAHERQAGQEEIAPVGVGLDGQGHARFGVDPGLDEFRQGPALPGAPQDGVEVLGQQRHRGAHGGQGQVRVGAAVAQVHQAGLGGELQFAQGAQRQAGRQGLRAQEPPGRQPRPQQRVHPPPQFLRGMAAQADAFAGRPGADQAGPGRQPQQGPVHLDPVRSVHVQVQQAPGGAVLQRQGGPFRGLRRGRRHGQAEGAGAVPGDRQHFQPDGGLERVQRVLQQAGQARAELVRPGHVGADHQDRARVPGQGRAQPFRPGVPGRQQVRPQFRVIHGPGGPRR